MLSEFLDFLKDNYSFTITELSETGGHDKFCNGLGGSDFIKSDFKMIDVDRLACKSKGINLSSVDGLYVRENDGQMDFYLVEFKKMNFKDISNLDISLKNFKNKIDACEIDMPCFREAYDKCESYLADKTQVGLELKPLNTLMLLRKLYSEYKAFKNSGDDSIYYVGKDCQFEFSEDLKTLEEFSKINYHYFIVYQFKNNSPNNSNNHVQYQEYFDFLKKLKPYPFKRAIPVTDDEFKHIVLKEMKGEIPMYEF